MLSSHVLARFAYPSCPVQTGNSTSSNMTNDVVSSVVRFYADPVESSSSRRRLKALGGSSPSAGDRSWPARRRSLLEDLGSLQVSHSVCVRTTQGGTWPHQQRDTLVRSKSTHAAKIINSRQASVCTYVIFLHLCGRRVFHCIDLGGHVFRSCVCRVAWTDHHSQHRFPRVGPSGNRDVHPRV